VSAPDYDAPCEMCGKPIGDHTIAGYADELRADGRDFQIPHREIEGGPLRFASIDGEMAGAVFVGSAMLDTAIGRVPALRFQFVGPEQKQLDPIWLVLDIETMRTIPPLVAGAVDRAVLAAAEGL